MMLRNAFRVFGANFSLVWKNLSYKLLTILIFSSIIVAFSVKLIEILENAGFFNAFSDFWGNMASLSTLDFSNGIVSIINDFFDIMIANFSVLSLNIIGIVLAFFLMLVFVNMAELPMTEVIKWHMSSLSKFSFCGAFLSNFWRATKQALVLLVIKLPFWAIIIVTGFFVLKLMALSSLWAILSPMLFVLIIAIVFSIKNTLFACFTPYLCLHDCRIFTALKKGVQIVSRRFYRTLSNNIMFVLLAFVLNFVCAQYTFGVALLLTLPATVVFHNVFNMVVYYESQGMRYYIDPMTIMRTKDFSEQDSAKKARNVI